MIKVIIAIAISLTAMTSFAKDSRICNCQQDFKDYMGNVSDVTIYAYCPDYTDESELLCNSEITNTTFSASCSNTVSGEQGLTSINLEPGSHPTYGYTYCRLN